MKCKFVDIIRVFGSQWDFKECTISPTLFAVYIAVYSKNNPVQILFEKYTGSKALTFKNCNECRGIYGL